MANNSKKVSNTPKKEELSAESLQPKAAPKKPALAKETTKPEKNPKEIKSAPIQQEKKKTDSPRKAVSSDSKANTKSHSALKAVKESAPTTTLMGKFFIKQAKDESYMFNLKASNGEIIATSDMYSSLEKCKKGIASVQTNAPIANLEDHTVNNSVDEVTNPKFELYYDKSGDYRFRLKARNGSIIAKSQGYTNKINCLNGIESVRKNALTDVIIDENALADEQPVLFALEEAAPLATTAPSSVTEDNPNTVLMGKFYIKQAKDGSYMFNLKASNGEIIATSDMYSSLEKCKKGIASVQLNAPIANLEDHAVDGAVEEALNPKFELYHDKSGDFRFRLKARNGSIIAKSQGYTSKTNCRNGIESVRKNAMSDEIVTEESEH